MFVFLRKIGSYALEIGSTRAGVVYAVMTSRMRRFGITFFSFGFYFAKDFLR
jgi:hypothetical protein